MDIININKAQQNHLYILACTVHDFPGKYYGIYRTKILKGRQSKNTEAPLFIDIWQNHVSFDSEVLLRHIDLYSHALNKTFLLYADQIHGGTFRDVCEGVHTNNTPNHIRFFPYHEENTPVSAGPVSIMPLGSLLTVGYCGPHLTTSASPAHPFVCSALSCLVIRHDHLLLWCGMTDVCFESN